MPEGKLEASAQAECARTGKPFEYAFLLDALEDEQDQGITIDTARCFFKTARATTSSSTPRATLSF
jgi:bifunctional enzyme CysN/CysC